MGKILPILVAMLVIVPVTAHAAGPSLYLGFQTVSFAGDLGEYYEIPPDPGIGLLVGIDTSIPMDLRLGQKTGTEGNSNGDLTYRWIEVGPRFNLGVEGTTIQPDWFFGLGSYDIEINNVQFDTAIGGYLGLGIDEMSAERFIGRFEIKGVYFKSDTFNTDSPSLNLSLMFGYQF